MRKVVVSYVMSLDGYFEGPRKDIMALFQAMHDPELPFDTAFDAYNAGRLRAAETVLVGRTTFEGLRDYWPPLADDPNAPPVEREISRLNNAIDKVVVSNTLSKEDTSPWDATTTIVKRADAHAHVAALKREPGREIVVFGSHTLWNDLLVAGLVDELHVMIGPAVLAGGTPAFKTEATTPLTLLESKTLDGGQLVLMRYAVRHRTDAS